MLMETWHVTITLISSVITGLVTLICTQVVNAYLKVRNDQRTAEAARDAVDLAEQHHQEIRVETHQQNQIEDLKEQVRTLVADLKEVQHDHLECVKSQAALEAKNAALTAQIEQQRKDIDSLREWRHEVANTLHNEALKRSINTAVPPVNPSTTEQHS